MAGQGLLMAVSVFLYQLKNVSFLSAMSVTTHAGIATMITATTIPKGFSNSESISFPLSIIKIARVVPQDGQGTVVTFLMMQKLVPSFCSL
jgi:hypothetical protein